MPKQCNDSCIYHHIIKPKSKRQNTKTICEYHDNIELKHIPEEEINNCTHFKTYQQIRLQTEAI